MARISPKTTWKLAKAIKGRRKAEVTKSGSAMVSKIDGSGTVWIRPLGAASDVPVNGSSIASVKVGDTVTYETGDGRLKVTGNSTDPAVGAGGATAVANAAAEAATKVLNARIGNLEATSITADSAVIRELEADTAKVHDLTADQLSAATAYIASLTSDSITAASLSADIGKIHSLTAAELSAAAAYIASLTAGNVTAANLIADHGDFDTVKANAAKVANLTAQQLEADHATIGTLDTTYMHANMSNSDVAWISNGVIANGAITNAMINGVSANKLTAGTINGDVINVTNLNANNITTGTINGQRIGTGSLSLDKLSEDVYTEAEVDDKLSTMQAEIDGAIETWTGTDVPTLNNVPASGWTTDAIKDTHVGDVYFVVNSQSQQNGYNYRFTKSGSTYSWQLIKDNDVTNALQRLTIAEGKITTFDSDISTIKTDTGTLTTKTESLETRMSDAEEDILDKVDTTTFNEVSNTVDQHTQTITQHTTAISNKADNSTVTAVTNRVSKNEQDISGINTTIGSLQTTVESKADGSTVTTISDKLNQTADTVDGHTSQLTSVTAKMDTVANPNLSPFFSMAPTNVYNATTNPDGYWDNDRTSGYTLEQLADGWAHIDFSNTTTGNKWFTIYEHCAWRHAHDDLKGSTKYTVMFEFRNVTRSGGVTCIGTTQHATSWPSMFVGNSDKGNVAVADGVQYHIGTTVADPSSVTGSCCTTRTLITFAAGSSLSADFRISLYEGEYSGPYKPYVDQALRTNLTSLQTDYATYKQTTTENVSSIGTRLATAEGKISTAESSITQNAQNIELKVSKDGVISSINQSAESVKIQASKVEIDGTAVFNAAKSKLDAAYDAKGAADTVQTNLDNLEVGGRNLLAFSSVSNKSPWTLNGLTYTWGSDGWITVVGTCTNTAAALGFTFGSGIQTFQYLPAGTYTLSVESENLLDGTNTYMVVQLGTRTSSDTTKYYTLNDSGSITGVADLYVSRVSILLQAAAKDKAYNGRIRLKLEKGNKATDWSPAPEDVDASIKTASGNGFYVKWDMNQGTDYAGGEARFYAYDPVTKTKGTGAGWVLWNGVKRTVPSTTLNPNNAYPYNIPIYLVLRLSSATSTTGTIYAVWYNGGWKSANPDASASSTISDWTWAETTDIVLASCVEPASEAQFTDCHTYDPPLLCTQVTTITTTAASAQALATTANTTANSAAPKANAVKRTQRIWYRKSASGAPSTPGTASSNWVTKADDGNDAWTKMHVAISSTHKYIYTCEQYEMANGTVGYTSVLLDNTITVIDGGNIITGSVTANKLNASDINASNSLTIGALSTATQDDILNSNVEVGGRNLLLKTGTPRTSSAITLNTSNYSVIDFYELYVPYNQIVKANDLITVSFDWSCTSTGGNWRLECGTSSPYTWGTIVKSTGTRNAASNYVDVSSSNNSGRVEITFKAQSSHASAADTLKWLRIRTDGTDWTGKTFSISNAKAERGNKATDWTPAPEDVDASVEAAAKTATNYISVDSTGIRIADSNPANATTYQHQTATNTEFVVSNESMGEFSGNGVRIGKSGEYHTIVADKRFGIEYDTDRLFDINADGTTVNIYAGGSTKAAGIKYTNAYVEGMLSWFRSGCTISNGVVLDPDGNNTVYTAVLQSGSSTLYRILDADGDEFESAAYGGVYYTTTMPVLSDRWNPDMILTPMAEVPSAPTSIEMGGSIIRFADKKTTLITEGIAEGYDCTARGSQAHAEGQYTRASGRASHAEGYWTSATGSDSHAEGTWCSATGQASHAEGRYCTASGSGSHASGYATEARSASSFAHGTGVISSGVDQVVFGTLNVVDSTKAFIIGNGYGNEDEPEDSSARSNAFTVDWDGRVQGHMLGDPTDGDRYGTASQSSNMSLTSGTGTAICSHEFEPGVYIIVGHVQFASNATGYRACAFSTTSGSVPNNGYTSMQARVPAVNGVQTHLNITTIFNVTTIATLYLNALQTSGSALNAVGQMRWVRLL